MTSLSYGTIRITPSSVVATPRFPALRSAFAIITRLQRPDSRVMRRLTAARDSSDFVVICCGRARMWNVKAGNLYRNTRMPTLVATERNCASTSIYAHTYKQTGYHACMHTLRPWIREYQSSKYQFQVVCFIHTSAMLAVGLNSDVSLIELSVSLQSLLRHGPI